MNAGAAASRGGGGARFSRFVGQKNKKGGAVRGDFLGVYLFDLVLGVFSLFSFFWGAHL